MREFCDAETLVDLQGLKENLVWVKSEKKWYFLTGSNWVPFADYKKVENVADLQDLKDIYAWVNSEKTWYFRTGSNWEPCTKKPKINWKNNDVIPDVDSLEEIQEKPKLVWVKSKQKWYVSKPCEWVPFEIVDKTAAIKQHSALGDVAYLPDANT